MILNYRVNKSKEEVKIHFINIENFAKIHPLIIAYKPEKEGYFKVIESVLPFLPKVTYLIKISDLSNDIIKMEAFLFNRRICIADIQIKFTFENNTNNQNITSVKEEVDFYTFAPFKPIFGIIFSYYHKKLFENIVKI
jgi:hypothetical protein